MSHHPTAESSRGKSPQPSDPRSTPSFGQRMTTDSRMVLPSEADDWLIHCSSPSLFGSEIPQINYHYYGKYRLVTDEISESWPNLPRPNNDYDERYVELYLRDNRIYKINHKRRSIETVSGIIGHGTIAESDEPDLAPKDLHYWKYVQDHPAIHSETIREIILDRRAEAISLMKSYPSGKPVSPAITDSQISQRLSVVDGLSTDTDVNIVRMISMVFAGVAADARSSDLIQRDDPHWMRIEHPNGWYYHYHPIHQVVIDDTDEALQIPAIDKDQDEETRKDKDSSTLWCIRHRQRTVSPSDLEPPRAHRARRLYWEHVFKYPAHHPLPARYIIFCARKEAMRFLQWCSVEALTPSSTPIAPFSLEVSQNLYDLLSKMDENPSNDAAQDASSILTLAMVLEKKYEVYTTFRFGEEDRDDFQRPGKPVHRLPDPGPISLVFAVIMSSVFLGFPFRYLRYFSELDTSFLRAEHWRLHLQRLVKEWTDSNLLATVLLAAAVGFLAIPDLKSVSHSAILISILAALGSLVAGLYCASKYQSHTSEDEAIRRPSGYAQNYRQNVVGDGRKMFYAIVLSLPAVLLLWAMMSFTVAVVAFNFSNPTVSRACKSVVSLWVVTLAMSFLGIFGVECAWSSFGRPRLRRLLPAVPPSKNAVLKTVQVRP